MSSKGGGGSGGGVAEGSRVSIPDNAKKTIQSIREITGKQHSDEEIYAILKECSMDPNETAQKLLYMDTFHDVKRKRDKKKETAGTQGRGGQSSRGNYYSSSGKDFGGGRNSFSRRENGVNQSAYRGSMPSQASQKVKNNAAPHMTKTPTAIPNGTSSLPNGSSSHGRGPQSSIDGMFSETKGGLPVNKTTTLSEQTVDRESPDSIPAKTFSSVIKGQEKSASNLNAPSTSPTLPVVNSSAFESGIASTVSQHAGAADTTKCEVGSQQEATESNDIQEKKLAPCDIDISKTEEMVTEVPFSMNGKEEPRKSKVAEQVKQSKPVEQVVITEVATVTGKASSQLLADSNICNGQHVIFPTHFQVSEALQNGLTFGSFDSSFGQVLKHTGVTNLEISSARPLETFQGVDDTAGEPAYSQGILPAVEGDNADQQKAPPEFEKAPESDCNVSSDADLNVDQSNQEMHLHPESSQSIIPNVPSYGLSFMTASATHPAQFEGPDARIHDVSRLTNLINGNSPAPSGSSTPPIQNSVAIAPQAVHLFRQPFPPNYFPYPHYLSPFYMHPMHQFLSPTELTQQPSTGNIYMPPGTTLPGVKFPLPQFKPGTNAGNPAHLAIPSGYGPLASPPIGFNIPVPSVTSGSSSSKEDIAALQLKENHIYTTGSLNEGSALWMPAPGQDLSNLQVNSLYNLSLHSQQLPFSPSQAGHGAFAGLYQSPPQTMAPTNINTLLQQSQPMAAAAVGTVGPPTGPY
ncbi:GBF-interacting protein 1-like isoform X2 [Hibiscus syriacus]|uniref:GBF-interacting protein 1-like isoform X2 n=1 Tax=Hibiscus syriacus TaxID=106335 RepID=UPI001923150F|nr:GBF-interacting protein 1-like isoform X2 [Hibiscus syriacus]